MTEGVQLLHATTVAMDGYAVAILGPSGAGKSDLALRLIDRGARLVSDDYTLFSRHGMVVHARPPDNIAGKMEVRGLGIIETPFLAPAPLALAVELKDVVERLPLPRSMQIGGSDIPAVELRPLEPSAPIKVEIALRQVLKR